MTLKTPNFCNHILVPWDNPFWSQAAARYVSLETSEVCDSCQYRTLFHNVVKIKQVWICLAIAGCEMGVRTLPWMQLCCDRVANGCFKDLKVVSFHFPWWPPSSYASKPTARCSGSSSFLLLKPARFQPHLFKYQVEPALACISKAVW